MMRECTHSDSGPQVCLVHAQDQCHSLSCDVYLGTNTELNKLYRMQQMMSHATQSG